MLIALSGDIDCSYDRRAQLQCHEAVRPMTFRDETSSLEEVSGRRFSEQYWGPIDPAQPSNMRSTPGTTAADQQ